MSKSHFLVVAVFVSACATPDPSGRTRQVTPAGQQVCIEPPPDVLKTAAEAGVDAAIPYISDVLEADISTQETVQRIRAEVPGLQAIEAIEYRLCNARRNGDLTTAGYEKFITEMLPQLLEGFSQQDSTERPPTDAPSPEFPPDAPSTTIATTENVRDIRVTSPRPNASVSRPTSIVGDVEFAQRPTETESWAVFAVIRARDSAYYFSTWAGKINYVTLRDKDVSERLVASWRLNNIYFGRPGTPDVGARFVFSIVVLKESEIPGVVGRVCPGLRDNDSCIGTKVDYTDLISGELALSAAVSDTVGVIRR